MARLLIDRVSEIMLAKHYGTWKKVDIRNDENRVAGGLVGSFVLEGDLALYMWLLEAGVGFGMGRGTTSGFGQVSYRVF